MPLENVRAQLVERFKLEPLCGRAGWWPGALLANPRRAIGDGFITPISQHFCATCNRVRLSVDGTLYLCLGQEQKFELRPLLRDGSVTHELDAAIREAIEPKPERHEFREQPARLSVSCRKRG
ncbi:hypothetical protein [Paludibacterium denitrificans]|uniref:hypothetical protein n=1 Tax=Paludibacterium denitrificans TaxID=2675226 RepID=UPI0028A832FA|nr:hypothetical protein [Paludibacterium denitrificans]